MSRHLPRRVAIVASGRTPFVKSGKAFAAVGPLRLAKHAVRVLIDRNGIDPAGVDAIAFGAVLPEPGKPNLAREIVIELDLPRSIEAQTLSSYCITGLRTVTSIADAIALGRIECGIAGGVESLSRADVDTFREPSTGLSMGQHGELTAREWEVPRALQDEVALASHRNAVAAREKQAEEVFPLEGVEHDSGPRADTSAQALAGLAPAFDREHGTITAGNASPVTDGAAALVLMSEERAREEGRPVLAFIRATRYGAIDIAEGLLMAPAAVVPALLERTGLKMRDFDLVEIHEAFAAQLLANIMAWERGWKGAPTGEVDRARVNVNGGSVAVGHPWSATGGRIVGGLAHEMARRDASLGLISICAAGAMAGAMVLERA